MNKFTVALLACCLISTVAFADKSKSDPVYVGGGRWVCSGNSAACAQIDQNNRQAEQLRQYEYQREQDRAQAAVERERRLQEQDRRDYGR